MVSSNDDGVAVPDTGAAARNETAVRAYFEACNRGDAAGISAFFTPDAVIYDLNVEPIRGAEAIGRFWHQVSSRRQATWRIDTLLVGPRAVAMEWAMTVGRPVAGTVFGSDHYDLDEHGRITEVRQYWRHRPDSAPTGLLGTPDGGEVQRSSAGTGPAINASSPDTAAGT